jgi:hypothetical protein
MAQTATGRKRDQASFWVTINGTSTIYPDDTDLGTGTTTQTSSLLAADTSVLCDGFLLTAISTTDRIITIEHGSAAAKTALTFTVKANQAVPLYVPLGGVDGIQLEAPFFGAKTANADASGLLFFRRILNFSQSS